MHEGLFSTIWAGIKGAFTGLWTRLSALLTKVIGKAAASGLAIAANVAIEVSDFFKQSKRNAKTAGALLACSLALREPFRSQSVTLVGFSLGCQVIKSCLKTLNEL